MISLIMAGILLAPQPPVQGQHVARSGKYQVELRVPEDGLSSGTETDVEFRVTDTTQTDPYEPGFKGVANVEAKAVVSMPSMPGMPTAQPDIHREGVPGDYGMVLFFPHGGDYRIDLELTPPNDKAFTVSFMVPVSDEPPGADPKTQPYRLDVLDWPAHAHPNSPISLKLRVIDTKTESVQTSFDIAHEQRFHLLLASKDLNWFLHEHPEMAPDGTWSIPITFPAGGDYWVYGDVAPSGKGSRILIAQVHVHGDPPTWDTSLTPNVGPSQDGGLTGTISCSDGAIPIGRMTKFTVSLTDSATGQPAGDTEKWLGAAGHLMIIHQDGRTVVHSHPAEDADSEANVRLGRVTFSARIPKPGLYKAYGQFKRNGAIKTLGFVLEVDEP